MPNWYSCFGCSCANRVESLAVADSRERGPLKTDIEELQKLRAIVGILTDHVHEVADSVTPEDAPEGVKGLFRIPGSAIEIDKVWFALEEVSNKAEAEEVLAEGFNDAQTMSQRGSYANVLGSLLKQRLDANPRRLFSVDFAFKKFDKDLKVEEFLSQMKKSVAENETQEDQLIETVSFLTEFFALLNFVAENDPFLMEVNTLLTVIFKSLCLGALDANLALVYYAQAKGDINLAYAISHGQELLEKWVESIDAEDSEVEDAGLLMTIQQPVLDINRASQSLENFMTRSSHSLSSLDSETSLYRLNDFDYSTSKAAGNFKEIDVELEHELSLTPMSNSYENGRRGGFYEVPDKNSYRTTWFKVDSNHNAFVRQTPTLSKRSEFKF